MSDLPATSFADASLEAHGPLFDELAASIERDGYAIARSAVPAERVAAMKAVTERHRDRREQPFELEAALQYPGAPPVDGRGAGTIRRLLQAHARGAVFTEWLTDPLVTGVLGRRYGSPLVCPLAHHNCLMTKQPAFSSETGWHQDVRYWSFQRPDLCSVWLPLGPERQENGALRLVPGSHKADFAADQFDERRFFRSDHPANTEWLDRAITAELDVGDVLFFHARTLHAAGRNETADPKYAAVFTFRPEDNPPAPGSRSSSLPELLIRW